MTHRAHWRGQPLEALLFDLDGTLLDTAGDSCERRKPDPQPLLFACESLGVPTSRALMVGDSINDVQAARGARIPIVCVPYGYNEGQDPRALPCDVLIESLADLPPMLLAGAP